MMRMYMFGCIMSMSPVDTACMKPLKPETYITDI
jgi:hypothetical protein